MDAADVLESPHDSLRLNLNVPFLNVDRGGLLLCRVTVLSALTRHSEHGGTHDPGARLPSDIDNSSHYTEGAGTGLGSVYCLGCVVCGC